MQPAVPSDVNHGAAAAAGAHQSKEKPLAQSQAMQQRCGFRSALHLALVNSGWRWGPYCGGVSSFFPNLPSGEQINAPGIHPCCLQGLHFSSWLGLCSGSCSSRARWKLQCWELSHRTSFAARIPFPSFPQTTEHSQAKTLDWIFKLINAF